MQVPRRNRWRLYRIFVIVGMSLKFFFQIWRLSRKERRSGELLPASVWDDLYRRQAREFRETALRLEGMLIKLGQFLSARADLLPFPYMDELEQLQDQITPIPYELIYGQLEASYGKDLNRYFAEIVETPLAAASLGQVHRATLPGGEQVAIKVQRPNIEKIIETDLAATRIVVWFTERWRRVRERVDLKSVYREVARTTFEELDYRKEASHLELFRANFAHRERTTVPRVYAELTRTRVLVMEYIEGAKVNDLPFIRANGLDPADVANRYVRAFLDQIMIDGFFHADPHPGNVFVKQDGTLVFLDFGMMGRISAEDRAAIQDFLRAIIEEDARSMLRSLRAMGILVFPEADVDDLLHALTALMAPYFGDDLKNKLSDDVIQGMLEALQEFVYAQPIQLPYHLTFLGRAAGIIAGVSTEINPDIRYLDSIAPFLLGDRSAAKRESAAVRAAEQATSASDPDAARQQASENETMHGARTSRGDRMRARQKGMANRVFGRSDDQERKSSGTFDWDDLLSGERLQQILRLLLKIISPYQNLPKTTLAVLDRLADGRFTIHHTRDPYPYAALHRLINRTVWFAGFGFFVVQAWMHVERAAWTGAALALAAALVFLLAVRRNTRATEELLRRRSQNSR